MVRPCLGRNLRFRRLFSSADLQLANYRNAAGIYHLQEDMRQAVFGNAAASHSTPNSQELAELQEVALDHLRQNALLGRETMQPRRLNIDVPKLLGSNLDEHFQKIGNQMLEPYLSMCQDYIKNSEATKIDPGKMLFQQRSGWVRYAAGSKPEVVEHPTDGVITLDTEVMYKIHDHAVLAVAESADALYVWLNPWLLGEAEDPAQLIPLGNHRQVVIGHYVAYDRKRVAEEYSLHNTQKWFIDTMGLHIATNGMCNQQRGSYARFESLAKQCASEEESVAESAKVKLDALMKQEPWLRHTSANGLEDAVGFHLGIQMDKSDRDLFGELTREELVEPEMLNRLIRYCALDVMHTKQLFGALLPKFLKLNAHPVTMGALRLMSSQFLPVNDGWNTYVETAETYYDDMQAVVNGKLRELAEEAVLHVDSPEKLREALNDPWLGQLDWTVKPIKYTKPRPGHPARPVKNQKLPGKPQWYKELFNGKTRTQMNLSSRSRTTALLLRLKWDNNPLVWYDDHGWCFWTAKNMKEQYKNLNLAHVKDEPSRSLFKLPHPDGDKGRCTYPLAKFYFQFFENKTLRSDNALAMEAIATNLECSYWISSRQRIMDQMPVFPKNGDEANTGMPDGWGMILPRMAPIGAVTRRAVEDTWLTASNAKKNRVGSELKSNVRAPPGYKLIGADVDSEELWIASVVGDSVFKMHGGTVAGWMTLEGTKQAGTDLHSKSAEILNISRNEAKVFNYGRIYGAGKASAARNLRQFDPSVSVAEADRKATELYKSTKGEKTASKHFPLRQYWRGGTESIMYNQLEHLAEQPRQRTPVLGAGISDALSGINLRKGSYLTTRVNWSIQSSGVDYLHLLIAGMHYLTETYEINARLLLTVHDEVRYLVSEKDAYRAGLALQIANLWTRAMFCEQLGFANLPYSVAFFSSIDFDFVLRKEVDDACVTPSQPEPLKAGEALDITGLETKCSSLGSINPVKLEEFKKQPASPREPVMKQINDLPLLVDFAKAQTGTADEARAIEDRLSQLRRQHSRKFRSLNGDRPTASYCRTKPKIPQMRLVATNQKGTYHQQIEVPR